MLAASYRLAVCLPNRSGAFVSSPLPMLSASSPASEGGIWQNVKRQHQPLLERWSSGAPHCILSDGEEGGVLKRVRMVVLAILSSDDTVCRNVHSVTASLLSDCRSVVQHASLAIGPEATGCTVVYSSASVVACLFTCLTMPRTFGRVRLSSSTRANGHTKRRTDVLL
ncbi:unnamed protein product [Protopolystoma xenopodis]|uniref:Uncharacterized protein n=1 Tax=Protopolystoma xenopodis TaxID=117903 RepID=A0A448X375_9PLAT|nr:unnamed protein product [Protopolystoma xenopodis]